jgi:hypothetical protein
VADAIAPAAANVSAAKDSDKRQRAAIESYARRAGFDLVDEFTDGQPDLARGSFEVGFPDGRPSKYFYWDDIAQRSRARSKLDC